MLSLVGTEGASVMVVDFTFCFFRVFSLKRLSAHISKTVARCLRLLVLVLRLLLLFLPIRGSFSLRSNMLRVMMLCNAPAAAETTRLELGCIGRTRRTAARSPVSVVGLGGWLRLRPARSLRRCVGRRTSA